MTEVRLPLAELLAKADDGDFLHSVAEAVVRSETRRALPRRHRTTRRRGPGQPRLCPGPGSLVSVAGVAGVRGLGRSGPRPGSRCP